MANQKIDFMFNKNNLYREESITDVKAGAIRCLIPVNADGTPDEKRKIKYVGHTQLMTEAGMLPIQPPLEATNLEEAISAFPAAMEKAMQEMVEQIKKAQAEYERQKQREQSPIITPGR